MNSEFYHLITTLSYFLNMFFFFICDAFTHFLSSSENTSTVFWLFEKTLFASVAAWHQIFFTAVTCSFRPDHIQVSMICEAAHSGSIRFFSFGFRNRSSQSAHACVRVHIQKDEPIFNIAIFQSSGNFFSSLFFKVSNQDALTFSHIPARCSTPDDRLLQYRP